ncbi:hypothetical protein [Phaffia rhodozyma]|uniref:Uncharacterized protein n=1 Tax=Phaffia rhodozyma TaxID=264483 RepID=A0A0F7SR11_PHARH|nr:hypothetical protein [Phaffia rhodozyma]
MDTQTSHPALALSLSDGSESDSSFTEVQYDPAKDREWLEDEEEEAVVAAAVAVNIDDENREQEKASEVVIESSSQAVTKKEKENGELLIWDKNGWDDMVLLKAFDAAREEYQAYHAPIAPYKPFVADPMLAIRSKERSSNSWKLKLELKEQLAREAKEAKGIPPPGVSNTLNLWYTRLVPSASGSKSNAPLASSSTNSGQPKSSTNSSKGRSKRSAQPDISINPYGSTPSKKRHKRSNQTTPPSIIHSLSPTHNDYTPDSPSYTPQSPTFSIPGSPSPRSIDQAPIEPEVEKYDKQGQDLRSDDGRGIEEEQWEEGREVEFGFLGVGGGGMLDSNQWDDSSLVEDWERQKKNWQAQHGTTKSWLDLALEAQARGESISSLDIQPAVPLSSTSTSIPTSSISSASSGIDKVAERNIARFKAVAQAGIQPTKGTGLEDNTSGELCYD